MAKSKNSEAEVVDALLKGGNPSASDAHAEWASILAAVRRDAGQERAMQQRAMAGVMQRLSARPSEEASRAHAWSFRWRTARPMSMAAVAACGIAIIGFALMNVPDTRFEPVVGGDSTFDHEYEVAGPAGSHSVQYVDFGFQGAGAGTEEQPYANLQLAVNAVKPGGVLVIAAGTTSVTTTFTKRMRIEAIGGSVRIGPS